MVSLFKRCHDNVYCGIDDGCSTFWSGAGESGDGVGESKALNY